MWLPVVVTFMAVFSHVEASRQVVVEASSQVANNLPNEPGNENFPPEPEAVEAVELEKALPVINIKYKWPASTFDSSCSRLTATATAPSSQRSSFLGL